MKNKLYNNNTGLVFVGSMGTCEAKLSTADQGKVDGKTHWGKSRTYQMA